jgi:hypothetical protein
MNQLINFRILVEAMFLKTGFWFYFFPLESVIEVENLKKDVISVEESYFVIVNKQTIEFQDELNM